MLIGNPHVHIIFMCTRCIADVNGMRRITLEKSMNNPAIAYEYQIFDSGVVIGGTVKLPLPSASTPIPSEKLFMEANGNGTANGNRVTQWTEVEAHENQQHAQQADPFTLP